MNIKRSLRRVGHQVKRKSSSILLGFAVSGVVVTTISAINQTPKFEAVLDEAQKALDKAERDNLTPKEVNQIKTKYVLKAVKVYTPTGISMILTIASMCGSHARMRKENVVLASTVNLLQHSLLDYRASVADTLKPKQVEQIEKNFDERISKRHETLDEPIPKGSENMIIDTGRGNQLFKDYESGFMFRANPEIIKNVCYGLTDYMKANDYVGFRDYLAELRLPNSEACNTRGWNSEMCIHEAGEAVIRPNIRYRTYYNDYIGTEEPIGIIEFNVRPETNYDNFWR